MRGPTASAWLASAVLAAACARLPDPPTRVLAVEPEGVVAPGPLVAEVTFSAPVSPADVEDGRRIALCREADASDVAALASADGGLPAGAPVLEVRVTLEGGGRRARVEAARPLWPMAGWAVVVGKGIRDAAGRPVVDAAGKQRPTTHRFETGDLPPGVLPDPILTEALARAAAPEAGGEYAEVLNGGASDADLSGFRLAKKTATGVQRCTIEPLASGPIPPRARGLVVGGAWDGRYPLPAGTALYRCGATALLGGLADDRALALALESPGGVVLTSLGWDAPAPSCGARPLVRLDESGPDAADNLGCAASGTPGR